MRPDGQDLNGEEGGTEGFLSDGTMIDEAGRGDSGAPRFAAQEGAARPWGKPQSGGKTDTDLREALAVELAAAKGISALVLL